MISRVFHGLPIARTCHTNHNKANPDWATEPNPFQSPHRSFSTSTTLAVAAVAHESLNFLVREAEEIHQNLCRSFWARLEAQWRLQLLPCLQKTCLIRGPFIKAGFPDHLSLPGCRNYPRLEKLRVICLTSKTVMAKAFLVWPDQPGPPPSTAAPVFQSSLQAPVYPWDVAARCAKPTGKPRLSAWWQQLNVGWSMAFAMYSNVTSTPFAHCTHSTW